MSENILPDVYTTVNVGNFGATVIPTGRSTLIVGTAEKGVINTPTLITSLTELKTTFGEKDDLQSDGTAYLTLVRAAEYCLAGGSTNIYCVRILDDTEAAKATINYPSADTDIKSLTITANEYGQYFNDHVVIEVDRNQIYGDIFDTVSQWVSNGEDATANSTENITGTYCLELTGDSDLTTTLTRTLTTPVYTDLSSLDIGFFYHSTDHTYDTIQITLYNGATSVDVFTVAHGATASNTWEYVEQTVDISTLISGSLYKIDKIIITIVDDSIAGSTPDDSTNYIDHLCIYQTDYAKVNVLREGEVVESWEGTDMDGTVAGLNTTVNGASNYFTLTVVSGTAKLIPSIRGTQHALTQLYFAEYDNAFSGGINVGGGSGDTWTATSDEYSAFASILSTIAKSEGYYVIFAGKTAQEYSGAYISLMTGFISTSLTEGIERIGLIGTEAMGSDNYITFQSDITTGAAASVQSAGRMIYLAQGGYYGTETVSAAWLVSLVAGMLTNMSVSTSLTKKKYGTVSNLEYNFSKTYRGNQVRSGALSVSVINGVPYFELGITTAGQTSAWYHITTRQIVDQAISSMRTALLPHLGENNDLITNSAVKAAAERVVRSLESSGHIKSGGTVNVYASRQDEIDGILRVELGIQPVMSVSHILVRINLS